MYAHEISGGRLTKLAGRMRQPRYFLNNARDVTSADGTTPEQQLRHTHFPSFFFGASGSSSPLHSDGAHLWPPPLLWKPGEEIPPALRRLAMSFFSLRCRKLTRKRIQQDTVAA